MDFRFEPRTYGPYSAELANELHRLTFWSELAEREHRYEIQDLHVAQDAGVVQRIKKGLAEFTKLIHGRYDFDSVELFGTVLLCCRALQSLGEPVTAENVIGEFKGWKGEKYHEVRTKEAFSWVEPYVKKKTGYASAMICC